MKTKILVIIISLLSLQSSFCADKPQKSDDEFRTVENHAFKVGEKLTFDVRYGFVTAGIATFNIPKLKRISGREAYYVTFEVNTVPSFDWIYKVR